jgi:hypothetical protein
MRAKQNNFYVVITEESQKHYHKSTLDEKLPQNCNMTKFHLKACKMRKTLKF